MTTDQTDTRQYFYIVKALAIFSTVCAHSANVPGGASELNHISSYLLMCWGTAGVPVFYFLSGYFFGGNQRDWKDFWIKKLKTIVIPWIFCATILWLYVVLRKGGISLLGWGEFIIGNGSTMYYITMLLVMYALFVIIKSKYILVLLLCICSGLSIIASCIGHNVLNAWFINSYLNPFNWILYFGAGLLVHKTHSMLPIVKLCKTLFPIITLLYILMLGLHYKNEWTWTYWSRWAVLNILIQLMWCFGAAYYVYKHIPLKEHIVRVGMYSYTIYLCHQLLVGVLVKLTNMFDFFYLTLLRPVIIIAFMYIGISMIKKLFPKLRGPLMLVGIREEQ